MRSPTWQVTVSSNDVAADYSTTCISSHYGGVCFPFKDSESV